MDFTNISKSASIEPYIECDSGYYALCHRCWTELKHEQKICPKCGQFQDWSWLKKKGGK